LNRSVRKDSTHFSRADRFVNVFSDSGPAGRVTSGWIHAGTSGRRKPAPGDRKGKMSKVIPLLSLHRKSAARSLHLEMAIQRSTNNSPVQQRPDPQSGKPV